MKDFGCWKGESHWMFGRDQNGDFPIVHVLIINLCDPSILQFDVVPKITVLNRRVRDKTANKNEI